MEYRRLGDVASISSGGTPARGNEEYWNGDIPWISAKTLHGENVNDSPFKITERGLSVGSSLAQQGDILILTRGSGLFRSIPVGWVERPVAFNQDIKCLSVENRVNARFLFYWLLASRPLIESRLETTGIGAGKIDTAFLLNMQIAWPDETIRTKVVSFFDALTKKLNLNNRINGYLAA